MQVITRLVYFTLGLSQLTSLHAATLDAKPINSNNTPPNINVLTSPIKEMQRLRSQGKLDAAKALGLRYLQTNPSDQDVMLIIGLIDYQKKYYNEAAFYLNKILSQNPNYLDARVALIRIKTETDNYQEAFQLVSQGLKLSPHDPQLLALENRIKILSPDLTKAQKDTVNQPKPMNTSVPDYIKQIKDLRAQNNLSGGEQLGKEALKNHPEDIEIFLQLGLLANQQKKYSEAETYFNKVLEQAPTYLDAIIGLSNAKIAQEKYSEALQIVNSSLVNIPGDPQLLALQNRIGILITPTGVQTESPVTPVQSQTEPTPVQSQTEPTPVQSQTEPTPVQSQTEPTPVQSQTEPTPVQSQTEPAPVQTQQNTATEIAKRTTKSATHFKEIQRLRAQGKVTAAKKLAEQDLKNHPDDIDTMLLLGLIANQQHNYKQADLYLNRVLKEVPTYVDARIGLITTKRAQGKHKEALQLYNVGLKLTPSNKELLAVRRNSPPSPALKPEPSAKVTHPAIQKADYYLNHQQDLIALHVIKRVLKEEPNNTALWLKKGEIERLLNWYPQAADSYHHALKINPELKEAKGLLVEIEELTPYYTHGLNEIGLYTDNFYVSDLSKVWDYTSLYMGRDTDYGKIVGKINFASRLQHSAAQYEINYSPRLSRNVYFDLVAAYSNEPMLFPTYTYGGEGFLNIPKLFEVSAGAKQHNIEATQASTYFTTYTGSIDKGLGNYWFAFRTSHFIPKTHNSSTLYTGTVRRYFTTVDHYLSATVGAGHSPDISDLITVNFLVIKNNFATLNYEFPIFNHQVIVDIGGSYQRWQYPSGLIRNLYGANVGGRYRF